MGDSGGGSSKATMGIALAAAAASAVSLATLYVNRRGLRPFAVEVRR